MQAVAPLPQSMDLHQTYPEKMAQSLGPCSAPASSLPGPIDDISLQRSSPFFRLPTELRLMVYHYVLGGYAIHFLRPRYESLDSAIPRRYIKMVLLEKIASEDVRQKLPPEEKEGFRDRELLELYNANYDNTNCVPRRYEKNGGRILLSLLSSCKLAYTEAIDILYTTNRFHFYSGLDLLEFHNAISPRHAASITSVQLVFDPYVWHWKFPNDANSALSSMKGLTDLTFLLGRSLKPIGFGHRMATRFWRDFSAICRRPCGDAYLKVLACNYVHKDINLEALLRPLRMEKGRNLSYTIIPDR